MLNWNLLENYPLKIGNATARKIQLILKCLNKNLHYKYFLCKKFMIVFKKKKKKKEKKEENEKKERKERK